jgi:nuclear pore complex protein Nup98-Nup96
MIMSQLLGSPMTKAYIAKQLEVWIRSDTTSFINKNRLLLYALCAGQMVIPELELCTFSGLDWKRAFGQHLWYVNQVADTISDTMASFKEIHLAAAMLPFSVKQPVPAPAYLFNADMTPPSSNVHFAVNDMCYGLLELYSSTVASPVLASSVLSAETYTPNLLDVHLSWLVSMLLHHNTPHKLSPGNLLQLHGQFADQLEHLGLWDWAVFVLQHIDDVKARNHAIVSVLDRNCFKASMDRLKRVVDEFGIRQELIELSLAKFAGYQRRYWDQARHLLNAHAWKEAHDVIVNFVAPIVLKENSRTKLANLGKLIDELIQADSPAHGSPAPTFRHYVLLMQNINRFLQSDGSQSDFDAAVNDLLTFDLAQFFADVGVWQTESADER